MKSWASDVLLGGRRGTAVRAAVAVAVLAAVLWILPAGRTERHSVHHRGHAPVLDAFERAGVTEFTEGQRGPAFRLRRFPSDGQAGLGDYADRLVVLNFWATWCTPCTAEMPDLERLWQAYRARGLVVLAVSVDRDAPPSLLQPYITAQKLTFPILVDPDLTTAVAWRVTGLPATFLVKPGGEVAGMAVGAREWTSGEMRALIESLLPP